MSKTIKSLLDPGFRYTPSGDTDLKKTFARVRREQRLQEEAQVRSKAGNKVAQLKPERKG